MTFRAIVVSVLFVIVPLSGCTSPEEGEGEDGGAAATSVPLESALCGFRIDVPAGWSRAGTNASGVFLFSSPETLGVSETMGVQVAEGGLMEEARVATETGTWEAGGGLLVGARIVGSGNTTLSERDALLVKVEGMQGAREVAWNVALAPHGNRTALLLWGGAKGASHSEAMSRAVDSFRLTNEPDPACGAGGSSAGVIEADGWAAHENPLVGWRMSHPEGWRAAPLSDDGQAIVFRVENGSGYSPSFMVIARDVPRGEEATLDGMVSELVRQLRARKENFTIVSDEEATLGGEAARRLRSTEAHAGEDVEAWRVMALHEDRLLYVEILFHPSDATFRADAEGVLARFRFTA